MLNQVEKFLCGTFIDELPQFSNILIWEIGIMETTKKHAVFSMVAAVEVNIVYLIFTRLRNENDS